MTGTIGARRPLFGVIGGGQSLCQGGGAQILPAGRRAVTTAPPDPDRLLMLDTGTITGSLAPLDPARIAGFAPIREDADQGESQGSAMLRMLAQLAARDGRAEDDWLYVANGVKGQPFAVLAPGTVPYANGLTELRAATALAARDRAQALRVAAATWSHGEADRKALARAHRHGRSPPLDRAGYAAQLLAHAASLSADIAAVTGQRQAVPLLVDQLAAPAKGGDASEIAFAQLDAVEAKAGVMLSCPRYFFRGGFGYLDSAHLYPPGYALLGEYHARTIHALLAAGEAGGAALSDGPGLRPDRARIERDGARIRIGVRGGTGDLVVDRTSLPEARMLGFDWTPATGAGRIARVEVAGREIVIALTEPAPGTLRYGHDAQSAPPTGQSAAWGNLRDGDPTPSLAVPGLALHNWLVVFDARVA